MQERKIRLIWDFRGPEALKIAEHHCVHLEEFALKANLDYRPCSVMVSTELYSMAFITVNERDLFVFRDALKPHRAEVAV